MQVITHERRSFNPEEVDLLRAIGTQVGLGIENGRLILELRGRVETESLLHRVSATLNANPQGDKAFRFVANSLARALEAPRCLVTLIAAAQTPRRYYRYLHKMASKRRARACASSRAKWSAKLAAASPSGRSMT